MLYLWPGDTKPASVMMFMAPFRFTTPSYKSSSAALLRPIILNAALTRAAPANSSTVSYWRPSRFTFPKHVVRRTRSMKASAHMAPTSYVHLHYTRTVHKSLATFGAPKAASRLTTKGTSQGRTMAPVANPRAYARFTTGMYMRSPPPSEYLGSAKAANIFLKPAAMTHKRRATVLEPCACRGRR